MKKEFKKVGFVGLGEMGFPMAVNLQNAGYQVHAYDVDDARCREAQKYGIQSCQTPMEAAQKTDEAVISIVRNYKQTEDVLFSTQGVLAAKKEGLSIIIMSTLDPASMKILEEKVVQRGYYLIDAPVSGAKSGAEAGTLTIMTAGNKDILAKCQNYFDVMGKNIFCFGEQIGAGQAAKLANNLIMAMNIVAFTEGMRFAQKYHLSPDNFRELLTVSTGNSWVAQNWDSVKLWWEQYRPNSTLDIVYKDIFAIMKECGESRYSLPLGALSFQLLMNAWEKKN